MGIENCCLNFSIVAAIALNIRRGNGQDRKGVDHNRLLCFSRTAIAIRHRHLDSMVAQTRPAHVFHIVCSASRDRTAVKRPRISATGRGNRKCHMCREIRAVLTNRGITGNHRNGDSIHRDRHCLVGLTP